MSCQWPLDVVVQKTRRKASWLKQPRKAKACLSSTSSLLPLRSADRCTAGAVGVEKNAMYIE